MYRHPPHASRPSILFDKLYSYIKQSKHDQGLESLLGDPEKQITSYGTSPSSSCPPTPGGYLVRKKPLSTVFVTEVTLTPTPDEEEVNPFDRVEGQATGVVLVEGGAGDGASALVEEEIEVKFPMTVVLTARRGYRTLQEKYVYDRFPVICAIVITVFFLAMSRLIAVFNSYYESKPLMTMMASNAILNGLADTMAQTVTAVREKSARRKRSAETRAEEGTDAIALQIHKIDTRIPDAFAKGELIPKSEQLPPPFDFARLSRFMAWGIIMAPLQFNWFKVLSRAFPVKDGAGLVPALKRVGCDQLMFAPVGLAGFFTYMTLAEGGGRADVKRKFENVYIRALTSNYVLWPAVQLINFRVMPIQFQLPFVSTVGIVWTTYLSLTNAADDAAEK